MILVMSHPSRSYCFPSSSRVASCPPHIPRAAAAPRASAHARSRSGRRARVRPSACRRRQRSISAWLPPSSTGGTGRPSHTSGRVVRPVEEPGRERLVLRRLRTPKRARQQSCHGVDQHQRRQLATGEHQIAHRYGLVDAALDETLIHALVPPGHQHQARTAEPARRPAPGRPVGRPPRGGRASRRARAERQARSPAATARPSSPSRGRRRRAGRPLSRCRSIANCRGSIVSTVNTSRATRAPEHAERESLGHELREQRDDHDPHVRPLLVVPMPVERHRPASRSTDQTVPYQRHQPPALTAEHQHRVRRQSRISATRPRASPSRLTAASPIRSAK